MTYTEPIPPLFRRADPSTSEKAAKRAGAHGILKAHQGEVLRLIREHPGSTARELAGKGELDYYQISRRVGELVGLRMIVRRGERDGCSCLWPEVPR